MTYAPICIPTLNRYEHLKRCIDSLRTNPEAKDTVLYLALDFPPLRKYLDGYGRVREYAKTIDGFKDVVIFERDHNFGPVKNARTASMKAYQSFDRLIVTEDDNYFSPQFLRYQNAALERYKDSQKVLGVAGYLPPVDTDDLLGGRSCFFYNGYFPYGWGTWRNRDYDSWVNYDRSRRLLSDYKKAMKILREKDYIFTLLLNMVKTHSELCDVTYSANMVAGDVLMLCPPKSLVRNTGLDGSGLHSQCSEESSDLMRQAIIEDDGWNPLFPDEIRLCKDMAERIDARRKQGFLTNAKAFALYLLWRQMGRVV